MYNMCMGLKLVHLLESPIKGSVFKHCLYNSHVHLHAHVHVQYMSEAAHFPYEK